MPQPSAMAEHDTMKIGQMLTSMARPKKPFGRSDGSSSKDRLEELLTKIEGYTHFLLMQNQRHKQRDAKANAERFMKNGDGLRLSQQQSQVVGGKESASKRRLKVQENASDDRLAEELEDGQEGLITRLYEQPS